MVTTKHDLEVVNMWTDMVRREVSMMVGRVMRPQIAQIMVRTTIDELLEPRPVPATYGDW